ncbi:MAG TPA: DUF2924 domain-containing protein [Bacteroidetes bacterium]|nr:DUF2924 domain-containing protein [Bacteroidota bacterium]HEX03985.1 DUF2924 domain-containing protein [Bacteroidota bacterium]
MKKKTIEEVQNLHTQTVGELKRKYAEVFGEETRSNNKDYLRKKIAWRLQSLDEGGLSERARKRAEELANDSDIRMRAPKTKTVKPGTKMGEPVSFLSKSKSKELLPGMTLKRVYKNQTLLVTVTEKGLLFNGKTYRSLSAIAKEVTGSLWNGRLFFGLTKHSREKNGKKAI